MKVLNKLDIYLNFQYGSNNRRNTTKSQDNLNLLLNSHLYRLSYKLPKKWNMIKFKHFWLSPLNLPGFFVSRPKDKCMELRSTFAKGYQFHDDKVKRTWIKRLSDDNLMFYFFAFSSQKFWNLWIAAKGHLYWEWCLLKSTYSLCL